MLRILCTFGIHKWQRKGGLNIFSSNVKEKYYRCTRCGKNKTEYIVKDAPKW
jgi:hypothetical protein